MKNTRRLKISSFIGCVSGLLCAFSTGMFLASGTLYSIPSLLMMLSTLIFIFSVTLYILWSH
ncbi:MAG: hypothetical protein E7614_04370 [Ruminococcaceae bacterium]|nr:hypothetical protein [Oscillospiraceae bacterium]